MYLYLYSMGVWGVFYWGRRCCFGGFFPCFGDFDVVICGGGLDGICVDMYVDCGF